MIPEICGGSLTADIIRNCKVPSVGGIEVNAVLINKADIDYSAITFDATSETTLKGLPLIAGKKGFFIQGVKQVNALKFELVVKEQSEDMFKHGFSGILQNASASNLDRLNEMKDAELVVVVETKFKGEDMKDAFKVGGLFAGLKLVTSTYNTSENDANVAFELTSADGYEEDKPVLTLLDVDYTTTKTAFSNAFLGG